MAALGRLTVQSFGFAAPPTVQNERGLYEKQSFWGSPVGPHCGLAGKQTGSRSSQRSRLLHKAQHCLNRGPHKQHFGGKPAPHRCPQQVRAEPEKGRGVMVDKGSTDDLSTKAEPQEAAPPTTAIVALATIVLVVGAVAYLIPGGPTEWLKWTEEQIESAGPLAPLYYAAAYCLTTVAFIPASILTLAAGYLFGPALGTATVSASSTCGAALAFLISRYAARPLVERQLVKYDRFVAVDKAISREGWKVVVLLRLSPLFPFALSNYALGLTRIDFAPYVAASWLGMLPATFAYVYLGSAGKATVEAVMAGKGFGETSSLQLGLYAVGAVATLGVTILLSRIASKALSEVEGKPEL